MTEMFAPMYVSAVDQEAGSVTFTTGEPPVGEPFCATAQHVSQRQWLEQLEHLNDLFWRVSPFLQTVLPREPEENWRSPGTAVGEVEPFDGDIAHNLYRYAVMSGTQPPAQDVWPGVKARL